MHRSIFSGILALLAVACGDPRSTEAPPGGWANLGPTVVEQALERGEHQLLRVRQGALSTWVQVPRVGARIGDHVLLGRGKLRTDVVLPGVAGRVPEMVEIAQVRVVDAETARRMVARRAPPGALSVGQVHAELELRAGTEVVVAGRVVKATNAVGAIWVHLQDGTGEAAAKTHDLTIQTQQQVVQGQWVAFRGTLRRDVDLGFGYHYKALVERGVLVE
ncbi:MAG: hypothetical protein MUF64_06850 [Polyangiaceae bacterium]|nr:hypothetical protein [Polyangiaceae bacterium]